MSQLVGLYNGKNCYAVTMDGYIGGKFYNIDNFAYIIADNGAVMDGGTVVGWYDGEVIHRNLEGKDYSLLENLVKVGKEQGA